MNEIEFQTRFKNVCIAHTDAIEWRETHGYGVGYLWHMEHDNFDQAEYKKEYFYSELWYKEGKPEQSMKLDFPFVLQLPISGSGKLERLKGRLAPNTDVKLVFYVFDILNRDRGGNQDSAYAKRPKEQVWHDCLTVGEMLIQELFKFEPGEQDRLLLLNDGKYKHERVYKYLTKDMIGIEFEIDFRMITECQTGTFNYAKDYPKKVSIPK